MAVTHYDVGDLALLETRFEVDDVLTDPTLVTLKVRAPNGTITTYTVGVDNEVEKRSTGIYFGEIPLTAAGWWRYRWEGNAPAPGVGTGILVADPDPFSVGWPRARALCTLEEAKEYAGEDVADTSFDQLFRRLIDDCAEAFYSYTNREFTPQESNPFDRLFDVGDWERHERRLLVGDLATTTGLVVKTALLDGTPVVTQAADGTVPAASIVALPRNRKPWEPITELWFPRHNILLPAQMPRYAVMTVTGDWGFPAVPGDVRQLALSQVAIWFERDVAKFSGTFSLAEGRTLRPRMLDDAIRDGLDFGYRVRGVG